jgi:capsular exopolysaccharide synthesis family protein
VPRSEEIFEQKTDFKDIIVRILRYKHYFVFTVVIAMVVAYAINKYSPVKYSNTTTILISQDNSNSFLNGDDVMSGFGMFAGPDNVENELSIIKSFGVVSQAIDELNFEVSYQSEENLLPLDFLPFKSYRELYKNSPIHVILDQTHVQPVNVRFYITVLNDSTFTLRASDEEVVLYDYISSSPVRELDSLNFNGVFKFGQQVTSEFQSFTIYKDVDFNIRSFNEKQIFFHFNNLFGLTAKYRGLLSVSTTSATSSIVLLSLNGTHPQKITDFLNTLTRVYLEQNLEKKNRIAYNTVRFIDSQISDIADSLSIAENKLQHFRSSNQAMNLSFQGQKIYEKVGELENEKATLMMKQKYYEYIKDYLESNSNVTDLAAPSSGESQDPVLNELIAKMMEYNNERLQYVGIGNEQNLFLKDYEVKITNIKNTILENVEYNVNKIQIALKDIDSRSAKLNSKITRLPRTERELIGMEREFTLNNTIYTFLLQKRAEAQIAQASNAPDYEVVDKASVFRAAVISPRTKINYVIAIFLGLFLPFVFIISRDFMNNRISDIKEIEAISSLPVVGQVFHNKTKSTAIILDNPKSPLADSFRAIRTNLQFFAKGEDRMVILITSSASGEGKSFVSINLASVYALLGKKVLLLGFDLRRPALYKDFDLHNEKGITSYLIKKASIDAIIQPTQIENLDLIAAGPIPPNPVELIASKEVGVFFNELKKRYDYIIIDSAPIGAVTDSFLLFKYADINVFTVRHNYTFFDALKTNLKNIADKKVENVTLLVNDIKLRKNAYGYSYQEQYYSMDKKKSRLRRMFSSSKKSKKTKKS